MTDSAGGGPGRPELHQLSALHDTDPRRCPRLPVLQAPMTGKAPGKPKDIRGLLVPPEHFPRLRKYYRDHGKWVKVVGPALLAGLVLWFALGYLTRVKIVIPSDNTFLIEAERERKDGGGVLLTGKLVNRGEDIPDLSLRSIGVTAEFLYGDGRTERKRVFPKSPFRGEGALFRGNRERSRSMCRRG